VPFDGLLYIGSSANIALRGYENHFNSQSTGFSTLRRSLGALLRDNLRLQVIPRGQGPSPSNFRNFRFEPEGEERLTEWMERNLEVGVCTLMVDFKEMELRLIKTMQPVLCLKGWKNPLSASIKAQRKICADEARSKM